MFRSFEIRAASAVLGAALALAAPAWGDPQTGGVQGKDGANKGEVDRLIGESRALFKKGDSAGAAAKLLAAWQIEHTFAIAANLGTAELDMGRMRDAAEHLDYALREMPASAEKEKRDKLGEYFRKAKASVGTLRIDVDPAGTTVSLDGKALPVPAPATLYVEPGEHRLTGEMEGRAKAAQTVNLAAGESKEVRLHLGAMPPSAPAASAASAGAVVTSLLPPDPPPAPRSADSRGPEIAIWILGALGAAGAGVYMVSLGVDARSKVLEHSGTDVVLGTGVGLMALGVGLGLGGVLFERSAAASGTAVWMAPSANGRGADLGLRGRF